MEGHRLRERDRRREPQLRRARQPQGDQDQGRHAPATPARGDARGAAQTEGRPGRAVREDEPVAQAGGGLLCFVNRF